MRERERRTETEREVPCSHNNTGFHPAPAIDIIVIISLAFSSLLPRLCRADKEFSAARGKRREKEISPPTSLSHLLPLSVKQGGLRTVSAATDSGTVSQVRTDRR